MNGGKGDGTERKVSNVSSTGHRRGFGKSLATGALRGPKRKGGDSMTSDLLIIVDDF